MILKGETEVLGEKTVSVSLCSPKFSHGLIWDQTRPPQLTTKNVEKYS